MERNHGFGKDMDFEIYYQSENLENTDFVNYEDSYIPAPDAFVNFTSGVFLNPQTPFFSPDDIGIDQWNELENI